MTIATEPLDPRSIDDREFKLLADNIPTLCWIANGDGYIVWYNRQWHDYCGTTPEDMEGWGWQSVHHPEHLPRVMERWTASIASGEPFDMTFPLRGSDGAYRPFLTRVQPVADASGSVVRWFGVNIDISDQAAVERELRIERDRSSNVLENMGEGFILMDREFRIIDINPEAMRMERRPREAMIGRTHWDLWPGTESSEIGELYKRAMQDRVPISCEHHYQWEDGHDAWLDMRAYPTEDGLAVFYRDVSERHRAEEALRESETTQRAINEAAPECVKIVASDGTLLHMNAAGLRMIEADNWPMVRHADTFSLVAPEHRDDWKQKHERVLAGESLAWEFDIIGLEGTRRSMETHAVPLELADGTTAQLAVTRDVTERKRAELALQDESYTLETLNRTGTALAAELDLERIVQSVTDAGVELTGAQFGAFFYNMLDEAGERFMLYTLSGAERSAFEKYPHPRATPVFAPTFKGEGIVRSDDITADPRYGQNPPYHGMPKDHLPVRSYLAIPVASRSGEIIGGLFFGHEDIGVFSERSERVMAGLAAQAAIAIDNARLFQTVQRANQTLEERVAERTRELERANDALRQAQKMEAIGQLTGGIAHDFNNLLTVIQGSAELLGRPDLPEEKRARYIAAIADTSERAARLTSQLLSFARRQALEPVNFNIAERIEAMRDLLQPIMGSRVNLAVRIECEQCWVRADPNQFDSAIVNMCVNSRDAMANEGQLTILVDATEHIPGEEGAPSADGFAAVSISDSGRGIGREHIERIFEPFFTTKEAGHGTGLGLSQVFGFAKQSGGEVRVESNPGEGATFTLFLPRIAASADSKNAGTAKLRSPTKADGRILVVEDNPSVSEFATHLLSELGYEAVAAPNGAAALELMDQGHSFDAVFTDVVMPGISGIELARALRLRDPYLPILLTSGYSDVVAEGGTHGFPLLQKPYSAEAVGDAIAALVAKAAPSD